MAGITIAGTALDCSEGSEGEPFLIGEVSRAYAGSLRNSVRSQKRQFSATTVPVPEATWDTIRVALANMTPVTVSGLILSGDSISASVKCSAKPVPGLPDYWVISLQGEQV